MPYRIRSPFTRKPIGRRGAFLVMYGIFQVLIGWSVLDAPPAAIEALHIFRWFPPEFLAVTWLLPGVICLTAAFFYPKGEWGFTAGYLMPALWGAAYLVDGTVYHDVPLGISVRSCAVYLTLAFIVLLVSGWSEPPYEGDSGDQ